MKVAKNSKGENKVSNKDDDTGKDKEDAAKSPKLNDGGKSGKDKNKDGKSVKEKNKNGKSVKENTSDPDITP